MKKILMFSLLFLSGCVRDLTVYPRYNVSEPAEKARLYVDGKSAVVKPDVKSKYLRPVLEKYFIPSSKQEADFALTAEKFDADGPFSPFALSMLTLFILPTWATSDWTYYYSLTDMSSGTVVQLSDVHIQDRTYFGWLTMPLLFSSDYYTDGSYETAKAAASAVEEAASLIYNPNSRLYKQEKKWSAPNMQEKPVEQPLKKEPASAPTAPAPQKPITEENMDLLW